MNLLFISGVVCMIVAALLLYVLWVGFNTKPHLLKMFQMGFFASLFTLGALQLFSYYFWFNGVHIPDFYGLIYSSIDLILAILGIVYYLYYVKHPPLRFK